ncbi:hypothetical protein GCM10027160_24010 [Streptomyces calidiresistens]|uniref:Uncharacterized protein n=1 Tax=Streptomyces calidiresistens TaxID=1485586 RepID=A0A7W3XZ09_9ACTN|nr:hypothetical protein [Streptomyces calidiresistens]MBB0232554.1 hypothetical protein [Streptomyces calidiresistens]
MTARPIGTEVSCDGPGNNRPCPDSAAIPAGFRSVTARQVRADGRALGWKTRRRPGRLEDVCPRCGKAPR